MGTGIWDGELLKWSVRGTWTRHEGDPEKDQFYLERVEGQKEEKRDELSPLRQWILDYLRERGQSSSQDLVRAAADTYSEPGVRKALEALEQEGAILHTKGAGTRGDPAYFTLNSSDEDT